MAIFSPTNATVASLADLSIQPKLPPRHSSIKNNYSFLVSPTQNFSPIRSFDFKKKKQIIDLNDDTILHIFAFLHQDALICAGVTCKSLRQLQLKANHLTGYTIFNPKMFGSMQNHPIKMIAVHCVRDIQIYLKEFPEYVYIGNYCSLAEMNSYRGISYGDHKIIHPRVKTMFIENAHIQTDFSCFPNLENLFIKTKQTDCNFDSIGSCLKLKKLIIYIEGGFVSFHNDDIMKLPEIEYFCVTGRIDRNLCRPVSKKLKQFIFITRPLSVQRGTAYYGLDNNPQTISYYFNNFFKAHHHPPRELTRRVEFNITNL